MTAEDIRAYVDRDWALARESKDRYWAERKRRMSPEEALAVADSLRRHVQALRPDWPTAADRQDDLETHVRVSEALRRVRVPATR